jgi:hypothetical protein
MSDINIGFTVSNTIGTTFAVDTTSANFVIGDNLAANFMIEGVYVANNIQANAAGVNTTVQYNYNGGFAGSANLTYTDDANGGILTANSIVGQNLVLGQDANVVGNLVVTGNVTANGANVSLGDVANLHIGGGNLGTVLSTDGTGNLTWRAVDSTGISNITSNVQTYGNGTVNTSANGQANILVITSDGTHANSTFTDDVTITGNLTVQGNATYVSSTNLTVEDPIIDLGTAPNNHPLTTVDSRDRGIMSHTYGTGVALQASANITSGSTTIPLTSLSNVIVSGEILSGNMFTSGTTVVSIDSANSSIIVSQPTIANIAANSYLYQGTDELRFMGWDVSNSEFILSSQSSVVNGIVDYYQLGNIRGDTFLGNVNGDTVVTSDLSSNTANITTLVGNTANFAGNVVAGNITSGNVSVTSNLSAANIVGGSLSVSGTVQFAGTSNIGNVANVKIQGGSPGQTLATDGHGNLSWIDNSVTDTIPYIHWDVTSNANNQTFSNVHLAAYVSGNDIALFRNGGYVEPTEYSLVDDTLTVNIKLYDTDTLDIISTGSAGGSGGGNSGVTQILAGNNISLSPSFGTGIVTINSTANIVSDQISNANTSIGTYATGVIVNVNGQQDVLTIASNGNTSTTSIANSLVVASNVTAAFFIGDGGVLSNITAVSANTANTAAHANTANTVTDSAQPNITSVGNLTSLVVAGNLTSGNLVANYGNIANLDTSTANIANLDSNVVVANTANISNLVTSTANVVGNLVAGNISTTAIVATSANITGNLAIGNVTTNLVTANTANIIGNILADNISLANVVSATQANIIGNVVAGNINTNFANVGTVNANLIQVLDQDFPQAVVGIQANTSSNSYVLTLPADIGGNGQILTTSGNGILEWGNVTSPYTDANVITLLASGNIGAVVANGVVSATGNVVAANLVANSGVSASGNVVGANLVANTAVTTVALSATGNVTLGAIANVHITGGSNNQVIATDGTGNLHWTSGTGTNWAAAANIAIGDIFSGYTPNTSIGAGGTFTTTSDFITPLYTPYPYRALTLPSLALCYSGTTWIAAGTNSCYTSIDGTSWVSRTVPTGTYYGSAATSYAVMVGQSGSGTGKVITSTDFITWTSRTVTAGVLNSVAINGTTTVAVDSVGGIIRSTDSGATWNNMTSPTSNALASIKYGANTWVAVGSGIIISSTDGQTWTTRLNNAVLSFRDLVFGNNLFVATGDNGIIYTSPDGTTWTSRTSNTTNVLHVVAYANSMFAAISSAGEVTYSTNGTSWTMDTQSVTGLYGTSEATAAGGDLIISIDSNGKLQFIGSGYNKVYVDPLRMIAAPSGTYRYLGGQHQSMNSRSSGLWTRTA